jgi:hypothetical protein
MKLDQNSLNKRYYNRQDKARTSVYTLTLKDGEYKDQLAGGLVFISTDTVTVHRVHLYLVCETVVAFGGAEGYGYNRYGAAIDIALDELRIKLSAIDTTALLPRSLQIRNNVLAIKPKMGERYTTDAYERAGFTVGYLVG